jgi:transposase
VPTLDAASRYDLSDAQWAILEPLLPTAHAGRRGRPRRWPVRHLIDGVRFRVRVGCPWRDVPDRYGPLWRVYGNVNPTWPRRDGLTWPHHFASR